MRLSLPLRAWGAALVVALLALAFDGCSDSRKKPVGDELLPGVKVVGYDGSARDQRQQRAAAIAQVESFTLGTQRVRRQLDPHARGYRVPKVNVLILQDPQRVFEVCQVQGASGCVVDYLRHPPTRVAVWAGGDNTLPALQHELLHLVIGDPGHTHQLWWDWDGAFNVTTRWISVWIGSVP